MTPKQRHRAGTFDRWRSDEGFVRCHVLYEGEHDCEGCLQAAHYVACSRLRSLRQRMVNTAHRFPPDDRRHNLYAVTLDALLADDRNGLVLCSEHHAQFDGFRATRLHIDPPPCVVEFAQDYGLEHELPLSREAAA